MISPNNGASSRPGPLFCMDPLGVHCSAALSHALHERRPLRSVDRLHIHLPLLLCLLLRGLRKPCRSWTGDGFHVFFFFRLLLFLWLERNDLVPRVWIAMDGVVCA